jgi:hypothetical protein
MKRPKRAERQRARAALAAGGIFLGGLGVEGSMAGM